MMKGGRELSKKELTQISVCQYLVSQNSYVSQEEIRLGLEHYGFKNISQATVSRLLKRLDAVKVRNARGLKVYSINPLRRGRSQVNSLSQMVLSVEYNQQFILIRTLAACGVYVAKALERYQFGEILGIVAGSDILWVALRKTSENAAICQEIKEFLKSMKKII